MKFLFQILLLFATWFACQVIAVPLFFNTEYKKQESKVLIAVANFTRSGISEKVISQKAILRGS